jgi:hypothetical protein
MRVRNEDRSPARVHSRDAAPAPTGFAEIVSDNFPVPFQSFGPDKMPEGTLYEIPLMSISA